MSAVADPSFSPTASPREGAGQGATLARFVLTFVAVTTLARLALIFATGLLTDEAYGIVISRRFSLSYFDHPPLHQWIVGAFARVFGEGRLDRLPFLPFHLLTSLALFGMARRLFSAPAAWWTVFLYNACGYFVVYPDGYIVPDPTLLCFLALGAWAIAEVLYGPPGREGWLWTAAGVALGLAGLSKYAAIFAPVALLGFLAMSPRHRHWLWDWRPYFGAALGVGCLAPALIWNAEHGWISLAFQSERAARGLTLNFTAVRKIYVALSTQIGTMTPWILFPLVAGLYRARRGDSASPDRFLLWLAGLPLLFFTLLPIFGQLPLAHWYNSAWLFAFPLGGAWLADRSAAFRNRFAYLTTALTIVGTTLYAIVVNLGPGNVLGLVDPSQRYLDFPAAPLREAYQRAGARFALIENWRVGGRLGLALGPGVPICAMGPYPQEFAFACDTRKHLGQNALIVRDQKEGKVEDESRYFESLAPLGAIADGAPGPQAHVLLLEAGHDLTVAPALPYGP